MEQVRRTDWTVCPRCEGNGTHDNPNFNGFTSVDVEEWDDFDSSYRAGYMSVTCELCHGRRVTTDSEIQEWEDAQAYAREWQSESLAYQLGY